MVRLPNFQDAARPQEANVLVHEMLMLQVGGCQAHVLDHDEVKPFAVYGPGQLAHVVADKVPVHFGVGLGAGGRRRAHGRLGGRQRGNVHAGKGDVAVAAGLEVAMAHHGPEAGAAANLEDALGRALGKGGRAHRAAKDLDEQQGAHRLAVQLRQVGGQRVGQARVVEVGAAIAEDKGLGGDEVLAGAGGGVGGRGHVVSGGVGKDVGDSAVHLRCGGGPGRGRGIVLCMGMLEVGLQSVRVVMLASRDEGVRGPLKGAVLRGFGRRGGWHGG